VWRACTVENLSCETVRLNRNTFGFASFGKLSMNAAYTLRFADIPILCSTAKSKPAWPSATPSSSSAAAVDWPISTSHYGNDAIVERINGFFVAKIIVVTSGKGGVGKTTSSASFSTGLAMRGHKTVVIDFDVGLRNIDLIMGCERRIVHDLINVIEKSATLNQALIKDTRCDHLFILPASQTSNKDALTETGVEAVLNGLINMGFDYIVCDSPAGIEHGALMALTFADEALIVTNPEVSSVRDSDRICALIRTKSRRAHGGNGPIKEHLLITRYSPKRVESTEMLSYQDIQEILNIPLIGIIPESEIVLLASNRGNPSIHFKGTDVAQAYEDMVARFLGEKRDFRFTRHVNSGLLQRVFGAK
jgi:septum site-determining protein MinD